MVNVLVALALAAALPVTKTETALPPSKSILTHITGADINGLRDHMCGAGPASAAIVNVKCPPWNAKGDGTTDDTAAIQAALSSLPAYTHTNPYLDLGTQGGGTIYVPRGKYKISAGLIVGGGVTLRGDGWGATVFHFVPTSPASFLSPDPAKKTVGNTYAAIKAADFAVFGENANARDGLYLADSTFSTVSRVMVGGFTRYGVYFGRVGESGPYYNRTEGMQVFNCGVNLMVDSLANVFTDVGSYLFHYGDYDAADYTVVVKGQKATFIGTSIEGRPNVAQVDDWASTTFVGNYSETRGAGAVPTRPFIQKHSATSEATNTAVVGALQKKIAFTAWAETETEATYYENFDPMTLAVGTPHFLPDVIPNPGKFGVYGWPWAGGDATLEWDTTKAFGNGRGSMKLSIVSGDVVSHAHTIPAAKLARYLGRRLYVTVSYYNQGATSVEPYLTGSSNAHEKYTYTNGVDFGNGWVSKVMDIPILSAVDDMVVVLRVRGAAGAAVNFTDLFAFLDGYDLIPYDRETRLQATEAPTTGTWAVGDRVVNSTPAVGQPKAWVCTVAGTPGTWVSEGNL